MFYWNENKFLKFSDWKTVYHKNSTGKFLMKVKVAALKDFVSIFFSLSIKPLTQANLVLQHII